MSDPASKLVNSPARAAMHGLLSSLGTECFKQATELRTAGESAAWQWRVQQLAKDLMLAAEELGICLEDLRRARIKEAEEQRTDRKAWRALREMEIAIEKKSAKSPVVSPKGRTSTGARTCRQRRDVSESSRRSR